MSHCFPGFRVSLPPGVNAVLVLEQSIPEL